MFDTPNPPPPREVEGDQEPLVEFVTISRAELDGILARIETPNVEPGGETCQTADTPNDVLRPPHDVLESVAPVRDANQARELLARDRRVAELEQMCKSAVRDRELATALAGKPLFAGAAAQLIKLWRDDFDVHEEDGGYKVTARDGRTVDQVVADMLASPEYSHFSPASSRGGPGVRGSSRPHDAAVNVASPKNLGEAVVMKWREEAASRPENLLKPIGLKRHR